MSVEFTLPKNCVGRFAVVKLWPEIKAAEDECISRLKLAAKILGVDCVEIYADGRLISTPSIKVSKKYVDFVIHLHFDTPKLYDAFSFVALWNPIKFYHQWGYVRCSRNLTTHDDFLSCKSETADDHLLRLIRKSYSHIPIQFNLFHSMPSISHSPSLGDFKLFYAGINWERVNGTKSRHQEILKSLDKTGRLRIYGPTKFLGVRVWNGYDSYVREIPFDGISLVNEISKSGVGLVLSSPAHIESELMSNRLFETVAAGALVICDENPFAKKYFGDSLLYIDTRSPVDQIHTEIIRHLDWAQSHPDLALEMIKKAQNIFSQNFTLVKNLGDIYLGLDERKKKLMEIQNPPASPKLNIHLYLMMPEFSKEILQSYIESVRVQEYKNFSPILVVDINEVETFDEEIQEILDLSPVKIELVRLEFCKLSYDKKLKQRKNIGIIFKHLLEERTCSDAFVILAPNESIFSNHLAVLAGALQRNKDIHCANTAAIFKQNDNSINNVNDIRDYECTEPFKSLGFGRFIFRSNKLPKDIGLALPYLNCYSLAVLIGDTPIEHLLPASIIIDKNIIFPSKTIDEVEEIEIIRDFCPGIFKLYPSIGMINNGIKLPNVITLRQLLALLIRREFIRSQINAIRKQGVLARLRVLKRKLRSLPGS